MILINLAGIAVIGFIVWWFWFYRPAEQTKYSEKLIIHVKDGIYSPAQISLPQGQKSKLRFFREDKSACAETVVFPELDISEALPVDQEAMITLPALKPGKYAFHCQMNMYRGTLIIT